MSFFISLAPLTNAGIGSKWFVSPSFAMVSSYYNNLSESVSDFEK
jgi:hypothetical protein